MAVESKRLLLGMCFLTWFSSALIFVQIPAVTHELKPEIFPSTDVVTSILIVAVTFSISLIARFLGGLFFGIYANKHGIKKIIIPVMSLALLTFCQILLILYYETIENSLLLPSLFIIIRFFIGFCIGGIWPNLGIFTLEEYHRIKEGEEQNKEASEEKNKEIEEKFRKKVQTYGFPSSLIQNGLTSSYFIEGAIIIALTFYSDAIEEFLHTSHLVQTQFTSIVGVILLSIVVFYWFHYFYHKINLKPSKSKTSKNSNLSKKNQYNEYYSPFLFLNSKRNSLRDLLTNRKYRFTLLNLWFISTGLMYMYYSTVIVTPELLYRRNLFPFQQEHVLLYVAAASLIGHIFLGFFYKYTIGFSLKNWFIEKAKTIQRWYDINDTNIENKDIYAIYVISICIIIVVAVIVIFYSIIIFYLQDEKTITYFMIGFQITLAFIANTPWALIPSILTSRFPKHFRFLAGSLAYNGGLIISFASPFFIQQVILDSQNLENLNYYLVLLPMILGGFSIMWGSRRLLRDFLPEYIPREKEYGFFEIRIPSNWKIYEGKNKDIKEKTFRENCSWIMSIYFLEGKNNKKFLDYDIMILLKEFVKNKIEEELFLPIIISSRNKEYISEINDEELYLNSTLAKKKCFFIKDKDYTITSLIIPYSNHIYIILYKENDNNSKNNNDNNIILKVIDTFDVKIPLKEI